MQKAKIPYVKLTNDQKIWIGALLKAYLANEIPDAAKILLKFRKDLSPDFHYREIDTRLFYLEELNAFGLYCYNKDHELFDSLNKTILCIRDKIDGNKLPQTFKAEEIAKTLKLPLQKIRICFKLIGHFALFNDPAHAADNFGYAPITIKTHDTVRQYLNYESVESFISELVEYQYPPLPIPTKNNTGKKLEIKNDEDCTPTLLKAALAKKIGLLPANFSKTDSPWKKLFDKNSEDGRRCRIPYNDLLPMVRDTYTRKKWNACPKTIEELKKMIE